MGVALVNGYRPTPQGALLCAACIIEGRASYLGYQARITAQAAAMAGSAAAAKPAAGKKGKGRSKKTD